MSTDIKRRTIVFCAVILVGIAFLLPTFARDTFSSGWISKPLSLGLDLQGGVHIVYEVESNEAVKSRLQGQLSGIRMSLREAKIAVTKARVSDDNQLEIALLTSRFGEQAKQTIQEKFKELLFVKEANQGDRLLLTYGYTPVQIDRIEREAVEQAVETLRNRVDQFGVAEPLIQRMGDKRILLQMPGYSDIEAVKKAVGKLAKLEFRLLSKPGDSSIEKITLREKASNTPIQVEDNALMTGDAVADARVTNNDAQVEVSLSLTSDGANTFAEITDTNVGRNLAIILDGLVYSSPVIREAIRGGHASISGGFSYEEATNLARILRAGALPAPLKVLEERTVGPTLGAESIKAGIFAIAIGSIFVFIFMLIYYKKCGLVADLILAVNLFLILALLSAFGATLTLPGLAGLALTIGMAVDSNVIIFERIKDEIRNGASRDAAVAAGFDKAFSAIMDSNITVLLSGIIIYVFGTGSVRGFAVTLCTGIVTTVFCAIFCSKLAFDFFPLKGKGEISI